MMKTEGRCCQCESIQAERHHTSISSLLPSLSSFLHPSLFLSPSLLLTPLSLGVSHQSFSPSSPSLLPSTPAFLSHFFSLSPSTLPPSLPPSLSALYLDYAVSYHLIMCFSRLLLHLLWLTLLLFIHGVHPPRAAARHLHTWWLEHVVCQTIKRNQITLILKCQLRLCDVGIFYWLSDGAIPGRVCKNTSLTQYLEWYIYRDTRI